MDILIEFIFELILGSTIEVVKERRISKWIRIPLAIIILLFFIGVFALIGIAGVLFLMSDEQYALVGGIAALLMDLVLIVVFITKMIYGYKRVKNETKNTPSIP